MIQNAGATLFHGAPGTYARRELPEVLWQETAGVETEKRGLTPEDGVKVFVPVETVVAPGDRLARGLVQSLPEDAGLVTAVLIRDYGSPAVQHKEVHCR